MKKSFIFAALASVALVACGNPETVTEVVDSSQVSATVSDDTGGPVYTSEDGIIAVSGYDTVSYFVGDGSPVEGSEDHTVIYNGKQYNFASAENAELFAANPTKYAPQYGGHCAWAVSRGDLAPGDPTKYKIVDGKLYLNFNEAVQQTWLLDVPGYIENSEKEWPSFTSDQRFDDA